MGGLDIDGRQKLSTNGVNYIRMMPPQQPQMQMMPQYGQQQQGFNMPPGYILFIYYDYMFLFNYIVFFILHNRSTK